MEADTRLSKFTALKAVVLTGSLAGFRLTPIEAKCLEHFAIKKTWGMWWWQFNKEEPLQEDIVVYEKFMDFRRDRERMNRDKEAQKERARQGRGKGTGNSSTTYKIPDPH